MVCTIARCNGTKALVEAASKEELLSFPDPYASEACATQSRVTCSILHAADWIVGVDIATDLLANLVIAAQSQTSLRRIISDMRLAIRTRRYLSWLWQESFCSDEAAENETV
jgi:hypothetical protein